MRFSIFNILLLFVTTVASDSISCTSTFQRQGLQKLVQAFISGTNEAIAKVPVADNVTSIIEIQGTPILLGTNKEEGHNAIRLVNTIVNKFGPLDPNDLNNYVEIGDNEAFVSATATLGVHQLNLPLVTVPATQNLVYDLDTCLGYLAVGSISPLTSSQVSVEATLEALKALLLGQGYTEYKGPLLPLL